MSKPPSDPASRTDPEPPVDGRASTPPPTPTEANGAEAPATPTDNSPTVISRALPRPATPDDPFAAGLRGRRLAHFELIEPIGVGGMAAVLRARDTQLDRSVALKILPPGMAADGENVRRFHQEARSAAKLDHENIARVFFCGEDQHLHFIAFEFVEGENLRAVLEQRGRLPVAEALHYMVQVAAGLSHANSRGVVHRDIKPSNIIITPNGRAKLVDMGLARSLEPRTDQDLTQSGVTLGTFDYISPEQALEPRDADVRSDIYSLGCTFYHMLTGRPPVPEGTAAKKLHYHQHVRPTDPRQLVPDLPDEVAVILDRMMAKQPRDRYQTPEQLVHHLLLAARKQGATVDVPEDVLAVEASLPGPPQGRPLLLLALASAAVVALVLGLEQTPDKRPSARPVGPPVVAKDEPGKGEAAPESRPVEEMGPDSPPVVVQNDPPREHAIYDSDTPTVRDLADWLARHRDATWIEILLADDLDLSASADRPETGLVLKANQVSVRPKNPAKRPTLRLTYDGLEKEGLRSALTIETRESAALEGLRFLVDGRGATAKMVGLMLQGPGKHRLDGCEFVQAGPSYNEEKRLASVAIDAGWSGSELTLNECCFVGFRELVAGNRPAGAAETLLVGDRGGQDAVVLRGPVKALASQCAFGPHTAPFRFEGNGPKDGKLVVQHCSVLAGSRTAVFQVAEEAGASLEVQHSLFSRPGEAGPEGMSEGEGAVLIRQGSHARVTYLGKDNRYHRLDGYWAEGDSWVPGDWSDFQERLKQDPRSADTSRPVWTNPWKSDRPLKLLEEQKTLAAFEAQPRLPDLRQDDSPNDHLVGVERLLGKAWFDKLPTLGDLNSDPAARRERVVDPTLPEGSGVYRTLELAVLASNPGDVILIRQKDGPFKVDPIAIKKDSLDVTIRPFPGHHPVLTLGATRDPDTALFLLQDGRLRFEDLEFRLQPQRDEFKVQALVALAGDGQCSFKNCVVTLDQARRDTALAVATLVDAGKVMKTDAPAVRPPEKGPRLSFEDCFVRGEGDLVWSRTSRPFELEARKTLVVLTGSFLNVEAAPSGAAVPVGPMVSARLTQVTTYLTGNLVRLRAGKDLKNLVPVQFKPSDCLFVAAAIPARALIHLAGPETEEKALKEKFFWEGGRNAYGGFTDMINQDPHGEEMPPPPISPERWRMFTGETEGKFPRVRFNDAPLGDNSFNQVVPGQFKLMEPAGYGADPAGLPRPFASGPELK